MAEEEDEKGLLAVVDEDEDHDESEDSLGWRRRRRERGRWAADMKVTSTTSSDSVSWKAKCRYALCTVMAVVVAAVLSLAVGLFVGQSLGRRAVDSGGDIPAPSSSYNWGDTVMINGSAQDVAEYFASHLSEGDIRNYLSILSAAPHIGGMEVNTNLALMMYKEWQNYSFDSVELFNYSVLLSYPNASNPNTLTLKDSDGETLYQSHIDQEPPLTHWENDSRVTQPFNAYSGSGNVTGPLVYVNYGNVKDFEYVTTNSSGPQLDLSRYICIVRYGKGFRGDKARLAQKFGCKGLLIYMDPQQYSISRGVPAYPNGPGLPEFGVQRGSLQRLMGDLLTPDVPAIPGIHRRTYSEAQDENQVPRIPVQVVSYGDAIHFMNQLSDHTPPSDWTGGLQIEYRIAQSMENNNYTQLVVNNYQEMRTITDVVAKLYGGVEPDRQVVVGNHRDNWAFGAVDPSSGTSTLMDVAKVIGQLRRYNWRPGRTLVLCSWDAEEYPYIGSTEWVEDHGKVLGAGTMAYINVDIAVFGGDFVSGGGTPLMYEVLWQSAAKVSCPNEGFDTLYDEWLNISRKMYNDQYRPAVRNLASGSDFLPFLQLQGISGVEATYANKNGFYDVYHSVYDNFNWMTKFGDPSFSHHRAVATLWITVALMLTTMPLPPLDPSHYSYLLAGEATKLNQQYGQLLSDHEVSLDLMVNSITELDTAIQQFQHNATKVASSDSISEQLNMIRIINDKMMNMERAFIHPEGLPGKSYTKHVIFAPGSINGNEGFVFPGLHDAIVNAIGANSTASATRWEEVKRQVDVVATHVRYATQIIAEPSLKYAHNAT